MLRFNKSQLETYFSPDKYISSEIFLDYNFKIPGFSSFHISTQAAGGIQKIENRNWDKAFRLMTEISYKVKHLEASIKYQTSDVDSGTGSGYKFNWLTFKLMVIW